MVVLDKYKAIFIEIPRTGSEAVRQELLANYGGRSVGGKHSIRIPGELADYSVFYGVSDPVDRSFSKYLKYRHNDWRYFMHHGNFMLFRYMSLLISLPAIFMVRIVGISFSTYLQLFMPLPFVDPGRFVQAHPSLVLRKESLDTDFSGMLSLLGANQVRPLPRVNETKGKKKQAEQFVERSSDAVKWRFNKELQDAHYPFEPFASGLQEKMADAAYAFAFRLNRGLWKFSRG